MPAQSSRQIAVVLSEEDLDFVKDALWYASRAEQIALSDDPLFRDSFLAELRGMSQERERKGKPGFQDMFLGLTGVPIDELPPETQYRLGIGDGRPKPQMADADEAGIDDFEPEPPSPRPRGIRGILRVLRDLFVP